MKSKHKRIKIWAIVTAILLVLIVAVNVVLVKVPIASNSLNLLCHRFRAQKRHDQGRSPQGGRRFRH